MSGKGRNIAMCIAGGYLMVVGGLLVAEALTSHPSSEHIFIAAGAVFGLFGAFVTGSCLYKIWKSRSEAKE